MTTPNIDRDKPDGETIVICNDLIRFIFNSEESASECPPSTNT